MFRVLSFDKKKIKVSSDAKGNIVIEKRTNDIEYQNIVLAHNHFQKYHPVLVHHGEDDIFVSIAEISEWKQETSVLSTFFYQGRTLEEVLRVSFGQARGNLIVFLRNIFELFRSIGFLWGDFAPRNMIWNESKKTLHLVDFERNLCLKDGLVGQHIFNRYVRNYAREEFSCFLSNKEQRFIFHGFLKEDHRRKYLSVDQITSKRKKALLRNIFGEKESYPLREIRDAEDIMVFITTPFRVRKGYFFPMDILDLVGSRGGPSEYAKTAVAIKSLRGSRMRMELKRCAENL